MQNIPPPNLLNLREGCVADNWKRWRQRYEFFITATGQSTKPEGVQAAILLTVIGEDALEVYNTVNWDAEGDKLKPDKILEKLEAAFIPKKNLTYERYRFFTRDRKEGDKIDQYVNELKQLSKSCAFEQLHDSLLKDRIVCGIADERVQEKLLADADLTLEKAIDICKSSECTRERIQEMTNTGLGSVNVVNRDQGRRGQDNSMRGRGRARSADPRDQETRSSEPIQCKSCGLMHLPCRCPAYNQTCYKCNGLHHFAKICRNRPAVADGGEVKSASNKSKHVDVVGQYDSVAEDEVLFCGVVNAEQTTERTNQWHVNVRLNGVKANAKLDMGAQANVISINMANKLKVKPEST